MLAPLLLLAADVDPARFVLFGPVPAVVEVSVSVDGRTVAENRAATAELLMSRLDADGSGDLSRDEAAGLEPLPGGEDASLERLWPRADADDSDSLDGEEVHSLLDAAIGPEVIVDAVEGRTLRDLSLEQFLDADADGRITAEEYAAGFGLLRRVDFDDDATLSAAELATFAKAVRAEEGVERLLVAAGDPAAAAQIAGPVPPVTDKWKRRRWSEIDADGGGEVSPEEAASWAASAEADLRVSVELAAVRGNRVTLEPGDSRLRPVRPARQRRRTRAEAGFGEGAVEFRVSNANFVAADGRDFLVLKHRMADADQDGSLSEAEYEQVTPPPGPFAAVDADRSGGVTREELTAYVDNVQRLAQLQVRLDVQDVTENLFDQVDSDVDRRLSPREVRAAAGGGRVAAAGRSVRITALTDVVNFLGDESAPMAAARPLPVVRERLEGPGWFRRMDRNRDGDLQWREFHGPREAFDRLDTDGDGMVDADEAGRA